MTGTRELAANGVRGPVLDCTLVWIDAREAIVGHWHDGAVRLERLHSDVPPHHRATGHVRHDPTIRHGGGGAQDGEANRLEHLARFIDAVATHIPLQGDLLIMGPGTVRDRLGHRIREMERPTAARPISIETAGRLTEPQLVARLRRLAGAETRRRAIGTRRWTRTPSGRIVGLHGPRPPRIKPPPPIEVDDEP